MLTGFGLPESNVHSPNERSSSATSSQGVDTAAALFTAFGRAADLEAAGDRGPQCRSQSWPNSRIASMIGSSDSPFAVSEYSTRGGVSG